MLFRSRIKYLLIDKHYGGKRLSKAFGFIYRKISLLVRVPRFDISLSCGALDSVYIARMRLKKSITFIDNDLPSIDNKLYFRFVNYLITPNAIPLDNLVELGARKMNIIRYNGFKEDIYIADFKPSPNFLSNLPFDDFITIRPEALKAAYISKNAKTIVPKLLSRFSRENINILYLPRYPEDRTYAQGYKNVYMPLEPLNGLDVCYYSKAVLTGSGTFAKIGRAHV